MKKVLKYLVIGVSVLLVLLIVAAVALPYILPLDKIKDMASVKISEAIDREVKIGKVSFNLFSGVKLKDLYIGNKKGFSKTPFISADAIEFRYSFLKLLTGKIEVKKAVLVKPEILIEQREDGTSNYSDLTGGKKAKVKKTKPTEKKEAISILVSKFAISKGKLTLIKYSSEGKKVNQLKDLNLSISNISLKTDKPIDFKFSVLGIYEGKSVPISLNGKILFDLDKAFLKVDNFVVSAANEKLVINADVQNFSTSPSIKLSLDSNKINIDKFTAILSGSKKKKAVKKMPVAKPPYGVKTKKINKSMKSIPYYLKADISIDLNNITYKQMKLDSFKTSASLNKKILNLNIKEIKAYNGILSGKVIADLNYSGIKYSVKKFGLKGFDAKPFSNDVIESFLTGMKDHKDLKDKVEGALNVNVSLVGSGVETPDILSNAKVNGSFALTNGKIKKMKSLESVGSKIGLEMLKHDLEIKEFKADFYYAKKIAIVSNLMLHNGDNSDVKVSFSGKANIDTMKFIKGNTLKLKLNPRTTKDLSEEYDAFKDKDGWTTLDFELTGSIKKPIPIPKLGAPVQKIIDKKVDDAKKQAEEQINKEIEKKKAEAEEQLKKELEEKAKELFKF